MLIPKNLSVTLYYTVLISDRLLLLDIYRRWLWIQSLTLFLLYWLHISNCRHTPFQIIHIAANFMRIWSIYSMYRYFVQTGASVVLFLFSCLAPASILFLILQKPWKGRPLSNTQVNLTSTLCREYWERSVKFDINVIMNAHSLVVSFVLSGCSFNNKWWYNSTVSGLVGKGAEILWPS